MAKKVKAPESSLFDLPNCTACDLPFSNEEWDQRHWGDELNDEFHEACCPKCNANDNDEEGHHGDGSFE